MKKILGSTGSILLLAFFLISCGDSGSVPTTPGSPPGITPTVLVTASPKPGGNPGKNTEIAVRAFWSGIRPDNTAAVSSTGTQYTATFSVGNAAQLRHLLVSAITINKPSGVNPTNQEFEREASPIGEIGQSAPIFYVSYTRYSYQGAIYQLVWVGPARTNIIQNNLVEGAFFQFQTMEGGLNYVDLRMLGYPSGYLGFNQLGQSADTIPLP